MTEFIDDGWRRRNVYDEQSQRYAKEQHLIACSDISVADITNSKRLRSMFCTTEAN